MYKRQIENAQEIASELKTCADTISAMDLQMERIRKKIEGHHE